MATIPNPVAHPLGAPTVSGSEITLDAYSKQPTRVTRLIADLTLQRFILDKLYTRAGSVSGGAVLYDVVTENDLYAIRDVEIVEPGEEFPIINSARLAPMVATPKKWGAKWYATDEAIERNDAAAFVNQARKAANTIVRKTNQYAIAVAQAAIVANGRTMTGNSWSAAVANGSTPTASGATPFGNLAAAQKQAEVEELGIVYDTVLLNPNEWLSLTNFGQFDTGKLSQTLNGVGVTDYYVSNRVTAGTAILVGAGMAGEYRVEKPLSTETWREQATQKNWWQTDTRPVCYITNPLALLQITGIA